jgi:hypothetical protein
LGTGEKRNQQARFPHSIGITRNRRQGIGRLAMGQVSRVTKKGQTGNPCSTTCAQHIHILFFQSATDAVDEDDAQSGSDVGLTECLKLRNCFRSDKYVVMVSIDVENGCFSCFLAMQMMKK